MSNNNHWQNPQQWGQPQNGQPSNQYVPGGQNYQYLQPGYQGSTGARIDQPGQFGHRAYEQDFKERNKGMYNSSMDFTNANTPLSGLSSLGRQVH